MFIMGFSLPIAGFIRGCFSIIHAVTTNENRMEAHGVEPRSTQDFRSTFACFYFEVQAGKHTASHVNNCANVR